MDVINNATKKMIGRSPAQRSTHFKILKKF